jgi:hypothetical protein
MGDDATGRPSASEDALALALARAHDALAAKIALIEGAQAAGALSPQQAAGQAWAAQVVYERDCGLARVAAETGWHTWLGAGGVLYARRERSSPPKVVRAATVEALAANIHESQSGTA